MFSLICIWLNDWVNNRKAGDVRRYRAHYDVSVMPYWEWWRHGMETIPLSLTICEKDASATSKFPPQKASNVELVSEPSSWYAAPL